MTDGAKTAFGPAQPHGDLQPLGNDIWWVPGSMRMNWYMRISRNMVVVRSGDELTLLNPIRLDAAGEAALGALGEVRHLVRLGCFHGYDDAYLKHRYQAQFWCQARSRPYTRPVPDRVLEEGGALPFADAQLLVFREVKRPECALLVQRGPGWLVTCDSLQHYADWSRHSIVARLIMPRVGFTKSLLVGPLWQKFQTPAGGSLRPDYERLLALDFDAVISAHGQPLTSGAKAAARVAVERALPREEYTMDKLKKDKSAWRSTLDAQRYAILFEEDTERAGTSPLNAEKRAGTFVCAACKLPLFSSAGKFDSGTGWPSFFEPLDAAHIDTKRDFKLILPRTEYHCARCGGHQGHVFNDGPQPTGLRYCNNGLALEFVPEGEELPPLVD